MSVGHLSISRVIMLIIAIIGPRMKYFGFGFNSFQKRVNANNEMNEAMMSINRHDSFFDRITIPETTKPTITNIQRTMPTIFTILSSRYLSSNHDCLDHPKYPSSSGSFT